MGTAAAQTDSRVLARFASTVQDEYTPIVDAFYPKFTTTNVLRGASGVVMPHTDGGERLLVPITLATPERAAPVPKFGNYDDSPSQTRTAMIFEMQRYISAWSLDNVEVMLGQGMNAVEAQLQLAIDEAMLDLLRRENRDLWQDGNQDTDAIIGFAGIHDITPATGDYGGVSRANNPTHQNDAQQNSALANLIADARAAMDAIEDGNEVIDVWFTGPTERGLLEGQLIGTANFDPVALGATRGGSLDASVAKLRLREAEVWIDRDRVSFGGGTGNVLVGVNLANFMIREVPGEADGFQTMEVKTKDNQDVLGGGFRHIWLAHAKQLRRMAVVYDIQTS